MRYKNNPFSFFDRLADTPKNLIFYGFIGLFSLLTINLLFIKQIFSYYVFSEWLVNYSQGFVRRGLPGTLFMFWSENSGIDLFSSIQWFSYLVFIIFAIIYLLRVKKSQKVIDVESLLILLFLPSLIMFPIYDFKVIGRKDFLFFFCLLLNLYFLRKSFSISKVNSFLDDNNHQQKVLSQSVKSYCYCILFVFNLLGVITAFSHEGIAFLGLPLNMIITYQVLYLVFSQQQALWRLIVIYLPTLTATLLGLTVKGNEIIAVGICQSWQKYSDTIPILKVNCSEQLPHVLSFFTMSLKEAVYLTWQVNFVGRQGELFLLWLLIFSLNALFLSRISCKILDSFYKQYGVKNSQEETSKSSSLNFVSRFGWNHALIPFAFSIILYITALDWGRWIFIISVSYVLCLLTPELIYLQIINSHLKRNFVTPLPFFYSFYLKCIYFLGEKLPRPFFSILYPLLLLWTLTMVQIPLIGISDKNLKNGLFSITITRLTESPCPKRYSGVFCATRPWE